MDVMRDNKSERKEIQPVNNGKNTRKMAREISPPVSDSDSDELIEEFSDSEYRAWKVIFREFLVRKSFHTRLFVSEKLKWDFREKSKNHIEKWRLKEGRLSFGTPERSKSFEGLFPDVCRFSVTWLTWTFTEISQVPNSARQSKTEEVSLSTRYRLQLQQAQRDASQWESSQKIPRKIWEMYRMGVDRLQPSENRQAVAPKHFSPHFVAEESSEEDSDPDHAAQRYSEVNIDAIFGT